MVVIAVEHFNIDARLRHASRDFSQLSGLLLVEPLHQHITLFNNQDARGFQRPPSSRSILEEKVRRAFPVHHPRTTAFDAHSRSGQRFTHFGQSPGTVLKSNRKIPHKRFLPLEFPAALHSFTSSIFSSEIASEPPRPFARVGADALVCPAERSSAVLSAVSPHPRLATDE